MPSKTCQPWPGVWLRELSPFEGAEAWPGLAYYTAVAAHAGATAGLLFVSHTLKNIKTVFSINNWWVMWVWTRNIESWWAVVATLRVHVDPFWPIQLFRFTSDLQCQASWWNWWDTCIIPSCKAETELSEAKAQRWQRHFTVQQWLRLMFEDRGCLKGYLKILNHLNHHFPD